MRTVMDKTSMICLVCLITAIKGDFSGEDEIIPCNLAEEGKEYDVNFSSTLPENLIETIRIESHLEIITTCHNGIHLCTTEKPALYNTTITQSNGAVVVNLMIYNASRERNRNDDILHYRSIFNKGNTLQPKKKFTCLPKFVRRADRIVADKLFSQDGVNVTFSTHRIYPRGKCFLSIYFNNTEMNLTHSSVSNEELPGDPTYFTTTCSLAVPKSSLRSGIYDVHGTMYPDINKPEEDFQYGTYFNYTFNLRSPRLSALSTKEAHGVIIADINSSVSVVLDIDGNPKPTSYTMIKNGREAVSFEKVTESSIEAHGYTIHFDDAGQTTTKVNVSITISGQNDFTSYVFIIDNGVIPALNYSFIITHDEANKRSTIMILTIIASLISMIVLMMAMGCYLHHKEFRDGDVYEEVDTFDEIDYNEMNLDNDRRVKTDNGIGDVHRKHDVLEDVSPEKDGSHLGNLYNRVIVQDELWNILGVTFEGSHNRLGQNVTEQDEGSDNVQDTARDDCTAVVDDATKTSNEYVVMKKHVRNHLEYITVQDLLSKT